MSATNNSIDEVTEAAARAFLAKIESRYAVSRAIVFGSRARRTHRAESDADIAIVIREPHGPRVHVALEMADAAFEVLLDTGVLIEALPLWEDELLHPSHFNNPALIESIRREGISLRI